MIKHDGNAVWPIQFGNIQIGFSVGAQDPDSDIIVIVPNQEVKRRLLPQATWTHFAITRDSDLMHKIYRNGVLDFSFQGTTVQNHREGGYEIAWDIGNSGIGSL